MTGRKLKNELSPQKFDTQAQKIRNLFHTTFCEIFEKEVFSTYFPLQLKL